MATQAPLHHCVSQLGSTPGVLSLRGLCALSRQPPGTHGIPRCRAGRNRPPADLISAPGISGQSIPAALLADQRLKVRKGARRHVSLLTGIRRCPDELQGGSAFLMVVIDPQLIPTRDIDHHGDGCRPSVGVNLRIHPVLPTAYLGLDAIV